MSSKYKHGSTNDEYSDAFIEQTLSSAPRSSQREMKPQTTASKARLMNDSERREWTEEIYSSERRKPKADCSCGSCTVMVFSIILFLIGLGIIVFGAVEKKQKLLPLCPNCDDVITGMYIAGGAVMFVSLFGIAAARLRHKCMAVPFTFFIVILGLGFIAVGVAAIIFKSGVKSFNLEPLWHDAVRDDPDFICSIQTNLKCSGFDHCCYTNSSGSSLVNQSAAYAVLLRDDDSSPTTPVLGGNASAFCYITSSNGTIPETAVRQCVTSCSSNTFTKTCDAALRDELEQHMVPFIAAVFPAGLFMFIMAVVSIKMTNLRDPYEV